MSKKLLIMGLATVLLLSACNETETEIKDENTKVEKEITKKNNTTDQVIEQSDKQVIEVEMKEDESGKQDLFGSQNWVSKDENGFNYLVKLTFTSETEGYLDYEVIDEDSEKVIEQFGKAPFTVEGGKAYFIFPDQETKDSYAAEGGEIKFKKESLDISIYRNTITFQKFE